MASCTLCDKLKTLEVSMIFQSKFKYDSKTAIEASKLAFKAKRGLKDKIIFWSIPLGILIMTAILIFDLKRHNSLVLDFILIGCLVAIEILNLCMPLIVSKSQAKYFKKLDELNYDFFLSEYNKGVFKEKIYKDNQMMLANQISIDKLQNYITFEHYLVLIFSNFAMLIFDLDEMVQGNKEDLLKFVESTTAVNKKSKSKKKH